MSSIYARTPATGRYFNGRAFEAENIKDALALRPGTTAEDFKLVWACPVEIVEVKVVSVSAHDPNYDIVTARAQLLGKADYEATNHQRTDANRNEIRDCARACRSTPDHEGNWESLIEQLAIEPPTLTNRIASGELTPEKAARIHIIREKRRTGSNSFQIRAGNAYITRAPSIPARSTEAAYVRHQGVDKAIVYRNNELQLA